MKHFKTDLLPASWLLLITFIVASSAGCRKNSGDHADPDAYETACPQTKVIAETPSPDGKLRAVVLQYADTCQLFYMENLSILPNDGTTPKFGAVDVAITNGDTLRPQWLGNRKMLVLGNGSQDWVSINRKSRFFGINNHETARSGQSFSYAVGWFDSVEITYREENEKYEVRNELLSEAEIPGNSDHPKSNLKAFVFRRRCIRQSTNETVEDNMAVSIDTSLKPVSFLSTCDGRLMRHNTRTDHLYLYKTAPDNQISVKWTSYKELLIIGSQPDGGNRSGYYAGIVIKYQQAAPTR